MAINVYQLVTQCIVRPTAGVQTNYTSRVSKKYLGVSDAVEVGVSDGTPMMMISSQAKFYQQIFIILFLLTFGQIQINSSKS